MPECLVCRSALIWDRIAGFTWVWKELDVDVASYYELLDGPDNPAGNVGLDNNGSGVFVGVGFEILDGLYVATKCSVLWSLVGWDWIASLASLEFVLHLMLRKEASHFRFIPLVALKIRRISHGVC
jgi:hypothetical protein